MAPAQQEQRVDEIKQEERKEEPIKQEFPAKEEHKNESPTLEEELAEIRNEISNRNAQIGGQV